MWAVVKKIKTWKHFFQRYILAAKHLPPEPEKSPKKNKKKKEIYKSDKPGAQNSSEEQEKLNVCLN